MFIKEVFVSATAEVGYSPHRIVTCVGTNTHVAGKAARDMAKDIVTARQERVGGLQSGIVETSSIADQGIHFSSDDSLVNMNHAASGEPTL